MRYVILLCLFFVILLKPVPVIVPAQSPEELVVFAASSLTNVFTEIAEAFEAQHGVQVTLNFAGSSTLAAQIQQGAPADVFASANLEQMQGLIDSDIILQQDTHIFAENELVIIVPFDNPEEIESAFDLTQDGILISFATPSVPVRVYTDELLAELAMVYGETFPEGVLENVVSEESNVRQITTRVALGEVDAGIVYRTDVTPDLEEDVLIIDLPENTSPRAVYPIATLVDTANYEIAIAFVEFVLSSEGQQILQSWGFCIPQESLPEITPEPGFSPQPEATPDAEATC